MTDNFEPEQVLRIDDLLADASPEVDDDDTLKVVRRIRYKAVDKILSAGIPTDAEGTEVLNKHLTELSKDAHKNKKLKQDAENAQNTTEQVRMLAEMYQDKFIKQVTDAPRSREVDLETLPEYEPATNETKVGDDMRTFDQFDKEVGERIQAEFQKKAAKLQTKE